jgi:hypothetical protein
MKPVLYVALVGHHPGTIPFEHLGDNRLVLVTSESEGWRSPRFSGRATCGGLTSGSADRIVAKFRDLETARAAVAKAILARDAYSVIIARAEEELRNLQATQRLAVKTAIRDLAIP